MSATEHENFVSLDGRMKTRSNVRVLSQKLKLLALLENRGHNCSSHKIIHPRNLSNLNFGIFRHIELTFGRVIRQSAASTQYLGLVAAATQLRSSSFEVKEMHT